jgi:hypothetical protein
VNTESRNAVATTFLNLHLRARLLWNPDEDVDALLAEFYPKFYGPAAEPMRQYWSTIYRAWRDTIVTEHEQFIAPAIYTPQVMAVLKQKLLEAEQIIGAVKSRGRALTRNEQLYIQRMRFTRFSHDVTAGYMSMVEAAATECDYEKAVACGERALAVREQLTDMSGIFTTYRKYKAEDRGYAWWPGEVRQYRELLPLIDGTQGKLIAKLPLEWAFRRDPERKGLQIGCHTEPVDLSYWSEHEDEYTPSRRKDYPLDEWEMLRTDLYAQAQGIRHSDRQSFTGDIWYRTDVELTADQAGGSVHLHFPGVFNECRLYLNGEEVARRKQAGLYWRNDYRFQWDVDLSGKLRAGTHTLALRCHCEHHYGGVFRRPFLYQATDN